MNHKAIFRKLLSIDTLLLFFAGLILIFSIKSFFQLSFKFNELIKYEGMVKEKIRLPKYPRSADDQYLLVKCYESEHFVASIDIDYMDSVIWVDDSVIIYTKPPAGVFSHMISSRTGNQVKDSDYDNEIVHMARKTDGTILKNYDHHLKALRQTIWMAPIGSFVCLFIYFMRRSPVGRKMIISRTRIDV